MRFIPAAAMTIPSRISPSHSWPSLSFRILVSTLPRMLTILRSGRIAEIWYARLLLPVPITALYGSSSRLSAFLSIRTSLGSSRFHAFAKISPSAGSSGISFMEWTAMEIVPSRSSSSISFTKIPFEPISSSRLF